MYIYCIYFIFIYFILLIWNQDRGRHCLGWLYPGRLPGKESKASFASSIRALLILLVSQRVSDHRQGQLGKRGHRKEVHFSTSTILHHRLLQSRPIISVSLLVPARLWYGQDHAARSIHHSVIHQLAATNPRAS